MTVGIAPLAPGFAGEVSGLDITRPLTREQVAALEAGMDRYAVVVCHDQNSPVDQQKAFSLNFGPLEATAGGNVTHPEQQRLSADIADVSNPGVDHKPLARDDRRRL
ncbi:TauD/TfdA family dioxygenase [Rhodopila sp.]|jgi:alpha-ketoglutarate-dependent 2,4-dichlorophenoxyacetate dioxygenase|uniref:TauD/TfdA family dioxygenase n=1 Tax=Rhodopila sp. TaxID=2480087 RepID=UPI002C10E9A6|nr:TauD/TfdA family dioxygenase [Rhodopila sp.]HVZ06678.1 TauD/TfdA family dioxygenase [Rhodopila sp.]